ncbi:hypothetical protein [Corynebacterium dentalis]|uniref:hypothetical protein n=1 Tax=Corynebacterium dentalis TaxID=2014528 RepID=UPI00289B63FC|nr:hypothetical protein [Corynebacterium dentalis]
MVNHQHYQSILDEYFSQVAEMTKEFEDVLKEQTELLRSLAEKSGHSLEEAALKQGEQGEATPGPNQSKQNPTLEMNYRPPHTGGGSHRMRQPDIFT